MSLWYHRPGFLSTVNFTKNQDAVLFIFTVLASCSPSLHGYTIAQNAEKVNISIAQKSAADFMQIDEMDIIYIIVYNSWTTIMPLRGRTSPVAPFLCQDVKSYGKEKYSVIQFSYSLIIHCFDSK